METSTKDRRDKWNTLLSGPDIVKQYYIIWIYIVHVIILE